MYLVSARTCVKKTQTCIVLLKKDANGTVLVLAAAEGH